MDETSYYEALSWIRDNKSEYPFASNEFSREEAIWMVESLYEAGATHVAVGEIYDEAWRIQDEGGPYSATLFIYLPPKREGCMRVLEAIKGLRPHEQDVLNSGEHVRIWWD